MLRNVLQDVNIEKVNYARTNISLSSSKPKFWYEYS